MGIVPLGCGADCSSYTELVLSERMGLTGEEIMFTSTSSKTNWDESALTDPKGLNSEVSEEYYSRTLVPDEDHSGKMLKAS